MRVHVMRAQLFVASFTATPVSAFLGFPFFKQPTPVTTRLPQETGSFLDDGQGVSPRPTAAPSRPQYGEFDLFRRLTGYTMNTDTCGYVATEWDDAFTCVRVGASCTNDGTFIGCCTNTGTDCFSTVKTTCIDYTASLAGACESLSGFNTLCCSTSTASLCHSYTFSTTASPGVILTLINCDTTRGVGQLIDYPPSATRSTRTTSSSKTTPSTSTTSSTTSESTSSSSTTTSSSSSTTTATPTATPSSDPGPAPAPVGAIVGGVVGGLAGIGVAMLAALFFWRRSKSKDSGTGGVPTSQIPPSYPPMTHPSPSSPGRGTDSPFNPSYGYQPTSSALYESHTTPPHGLAYAVPGPEHPVSMYGSPPLHQAGWEGAVPGQQPAQSPHKTPSPVGAGVPYDYGMPPPQQQLSISASISTAGPIRANSGTSLIYGNERTSTDDTVRKW
ncbi:hypothetical protein CONLIGDRAFT_36655 [Coniochaeta ligniaria NRRL 30616]|uniref:Mid2 domain-containing protein n=1 Tax=Coniochaeta ligniaria NRRL 30616 TaxID=1408157 RepID=A0A1J7J6A3_9PEZI|nr:hypothetical protein CONLIGDRAFT_36655 [Coniochaeta ligniaria NRRL 30616]